MQFIRTHWEWFAQRAHGAHTKAWLFTLSFSESSFFIIPPDFLLVAILLAGSHRWFYYATFTTIASIMGAIFGYGIAVLFFEAVGEPLIQFYQWEDQMETVRVLFERDAFGAILLGAFTPIPYKVFVLAAGFMRIDFITFLVASIIGRYLRYLFIAYATHRLGAPVLEIARRYSTTATIVAFIVLLLYMLRHVVL